MADKTKLPILIFPEGKCGSLAAALVGGSCGGVVRVGPETLCVSFPPGTCINNTSVMMFKKGSFEIGGLIYPVAIKVTLPQSPDGALSRGAVGVAHGV